MIETLFQSCVQLNPESCRREDVITPPECVLRHWQYVNNMASSLSLQEYGGQSANVPPCTKTNLESILRDMGRFDLADAVIAKSQPNSPTSITRPSEIIPRR